jgi:hypothetical protein
MRSKSISQEEELRLT